MGLLRAVLRRARHDLELVDRPGAVAVGRAETIGAGVTSADDDHVLAFCADGRFVEVALLDLVRPGQEFHGLVNTGQLAALDREIAGLGCAAAQDDGVMLDTQFVGGHVDAHIHVGPEDRPLGLHLFKATVEVTLFHLELGDAVAQETADAIGSFVHDHLVSGTGELLGGCEAGGARADYGNLLARLGGRRHRHDPTLGEGAVDDLDLDALDRDGRLVNAENTR